MTCPGILCEAYEVGFLCEAYKAGFLCEAYEVGFDFVFPLEQSQ